MSGTVDAYLADEAETLAFGARLAELGLSTELVCLQGELGVGKTTLVRGYLRALGLRGAVKSPTYTLLESYEIAARRVYHFDFYRINDPRELDYIGLDDLMDEPAVKLVEWPANAGDRLPAAQVEIRLDVQGRGRYVELLDRR
ncbi:MAG: tRNA (adenosine(37)-N6)-threonylcarbamoyltransferase complex ATPase subunit type 1 TsaE [Gammaproteobacteria bacterium]|nr:tRNA (adenosine(37)-N6)-threonylcarbamoyltransferase complex ATPase subunit type 1 TsaE [Gammaproteobacteria bacterium]